MIKKTVAALLVALAAWVFPNGAEAQQGWNVRVGDEYTYQRTSYDTSKPLQEKPAIRTYRVVQTGDTMVLRDGSTDIAHRASGARFQQGRETYSGSLHGAAFANFPHTTGKRWSAQHTHMRDGAVIGESQLDCRVTEAGRDEAAVVCVDDFTPTRQPQVRRTVTIRYQTQTGMPSLTRMEYPGGWWQSELIQYIPAGGRAVSGR